MDRLFAFSASLPCFVNYVAFERAYGKIQAHLQTKLVFLSYCQLLQVSQRCRIALKVLHTYWSHRAPRAVCISAACWRGLLAGIWRAADDFSFFEIALVHVVLVCFLAFRALLKAAVSVFRGSMALSPEITAEALPIHSCSLRHVRACCWAT
jgi:hypothetical protein